MRLHEPDPRDDDDVEVVDALPVSPEEPLGGSAGSAAPGRASARVSGPEPVASPLARHAGVAPARTVPVAQAAAVAATGFAAGAVTAAMIRGLTKRHAVKAAAKRPGRGGLPIVGSRSFLVDVHLLGPRD